MVKWFGINKTVSHEKVESLPIGIENSRIDFEIDRELILKKVQNKQKVTKNLLYINHFWRHNPSERIEPFKLFNNSTWATCVNVGLSLNGNWYEEFLDEINSHKFVLCPEGVGPDTYRIWETLYLGSIPIIKSKIFSEYYKDLPVCFVNEWGEITEDFLNNEYDRIKSENFNLKKMDLKYWKSKIMDEINKL